MKFLGEMKRRHVFRNGLFYILCAWLVIQFGTVMAEDMNAPSWVMGLVITFLVAGFPIALFFSWNFAWTKQGIRKESDVDLNPNLVRRSGHKLDVITMALLAAVVGMALLDKFMPQPAGLNQPGASVQSNIEPEPLRPILENSIAVLPFVNMSAEENQDYFSDGLSEELLNVLTRVDGLYVASRTSSFAFKGQEESISRIANTLRVANILEGSVRKVGDRLRITAQLIDASNDIHLWSDHYDRDMTDIFQIQDEIANAIVAALTTEMGVGGLEAVNVVNATSNLDAYDLYLKARELFIARENLQTSWQLLQKATSLDPEFARAWETLAAVHSVATSWFPGDGIDHDSLALAASRRALELEPDLSMPHAVIAMKHAVTGEGFPGAVRSLDQAVDNDPRNATALLWRGITWFNMGYRERAVEDFDACLLVDPGYLNCRQYRAMTLMILGRVTEGIREFEETLASNFHSTTGAFVPYYVHSGQKPMAHTVASLALRNQFAPVSHWIDAIEDPDGDHSSRVARFNEWGKAHNRDICDMDFVAIVMRQEQCMARDVNEELKWMLDAAWFRKTQAFKDYVNTHLMAYWQENGFPPQCRALEDGDFECD